MPPIPARANDRTSIAAPTPSPAGATVTRQNNGKGNVHNGQRSAMAAGWTGVGDRVARERERRSRARERSKSATRLLREQQALAKQRAESSGPAARQAKRKEYDRMRSSTSRSSRTGSSTTETRDAGISTRRAASASRSVEPKTGAHVSVISSRGRGDVIPSRGRGAASCAMGYGHASLSKAISTEAPDGGVRSHKQGNSHVARVAACLPVSNSQAPSMYRANMSSRPKDPPTQEAERQAAITARSNWIARELRQSKQTELMRKANIRENLKKVDDARRAALAPSRSRARSAAPTTRRQPPANDDRPRPRSSSARRGTAVTPPPPPLSSRDASKPATPDGAATGDMESVTVTGLERDPREPMSPAVVNRSAELVVRTPSEGTRSAGKENRVDGGRGRRRRFFFAEDEINASESQSQDFKRPLETCEAAGVTLFPVPFGQGHAAMQMPSGEHVGGWLGTRWGAIDEYEAGSVDYTSDRDHARNGGGESTPESALVGDGGDEVAGAAVKPPAAHVEADCTDSLPLDTAAAEAVSAAEFLDLEMAAFEKQVAEAGEAVSPVAFQRRAVVSGFENITGSSAPKAAQVRAMLDVLNPELASIQANMDMLQVRFAEGAPSNEAQQMEALVVYDKSSRTAGDGSDVDSRKAAKEFLEQAVDTAIEKASAMLGSGDDQRFVRKQEIASVLLQKLVSLYADADRPLHIPEDEEDYAQYPLFNDMLDFVAAVSPRFFNKLTSDDASETCSSPDDTVLETIDEENEIDSNVGEEPDGDRAGAKDRVEKLKESATVETFESATREVVKETTFLNEEMGDGSIGFRAIDTIPMRATGVARGFSADALGLKKPCGFGMVYPSLPDRRKKTCEGRYEGVPPLVTSCFEGYDWAGILEEPEDTPGHKGPWPGDEEKDKQTECASSAFAQATAMADVSAFDADPMTWAGYVRLSAASSTRSWLLCPLLLEAMGQVSTARSAFCFTRPASWELYVDQLRRGLSADDNVELLVSMLSKYEGANYIDAHEQEVAMSSCGGAAMTEMLVLWTAKVRGGSGEMVEDLPSLR